MHHYPLYYITKNAIITHTSRFFEYTSQHYRIYLIIFFKYTSRFFEYASQNYEIYIKMFKIYIKIFPIHIKFFRIYITRFSNKATFYTQWIRSIYLLDEKTKDNFTSKINSVSDIIKLFVWSNLTVFNRSLSSVMRFKTANLWPLISWKRQKFKEYYWSKVIRNKVLNNTFHFLSVWTL